VTVSHDLNNYRPSLTRVFSCSTSQTTRWRRHSWLPAVFHTRSFALDFIKIAIWAASGVVCLIRREAIEESCATGALEPVLATVARGV
jgi:hypothetical protein